MTGCSRGIHSVPEDAPARCILAHFLADAQDGLDDEIAWDEVSLAESAKISDDDLRAFHPAKHVAGFMSSLHLNLADAYRRLGRFEAAGRHLESSLAGNGTDRRPARRRRLPRLDRHWANACRRGDRGTRQRDALLVAATESSPHCPSRTNCGHSLDNPARDDSETANKAKVTDR